MGKLRSRSLKILMACILIFSFVASYLPANVLAGENDPRNRINKIFNTSEFKDYKEGDDIFYYIITKKAENDKPGEVALSLFSTQSETPMTVTIPETVEFVGCTFKVTCIKTNTFREALVEEIVLSKNIKKIEGFAFSRSTLKRISIPKNVKSIEVGALAYCYYLEDITVDPEHTKYYAENGMLFTKSKKTLIATKVFDTECVIPKPVRNVQDFALSNCYYISDRLKNKDWLKRITFPSTVKSIGKGNFNARVIVIQGYAPTIRSTTNEYQLIIVPKKYVEKYKELAYNGENVFVEKRVMYRPKYYYDNVKFMKALNPDDYLEKQSGAITKKAKAITKGLKTEREKALALTIFVNDNVYQDHGALTDELNNNDLAKPEYVLENMQGASNGVCNLVTALFNAAGIPCLTISPDKNSGGYRSTVYNLAYVDGEWIIIDLINFGSIIYYRGKYTQTFSEQAFFDMDIYLYSLTDGMYFYHYFDK